MRTLRIGFHAFCYLILLAAVVQVARADEHTPAATHEHQAAPAIDDVLKSIDAKKVSLDDKEVQLNDREKAIQKREQDLDEKIRKLENLRASIRQDMDEQKKNNEERVIKLVAVFETMTPKSASGVLETLDDGLAVEVLKRIETKRMAKILNIMDKARSAKLSELMTGYYNPSLVGQAGSASKKTSRVPAQSEGSTSSKAAMPESAPSQSPKAPAGNATANALDSMKGGNK